MLRYFKRAALLLVIVFTGVGCVSVAENPYYLGQGVDAEISSSELKVTVDPEVTKDFVTSNTTAAAGGGLLFALIDASVNNSRQNAGEKLLADFNTALDDDELIDILGSPLVEALTSVEWLNLGATSVKPIRTELEEGEKIDVNASIESDADLLLLVSYRIEFNKTVDAVQVFANISGYPHKDTLQAYAQKYNAEKPLDPFNTIFLDSLSVSMPLDAKESKEETLADLAENEAAVFKRLMVTAAETLAEKAKQSLGQRTLR